MLSAHTASSHNKPLLQDSICLEILLNKVIDTERSEHTAVRPVVPLFLSPCPPHLFTTLEPIRVLKISVPQKRLIFVLQNPLLIFFGVLDLILKNTPSLYTSESTNQNKNSSLAGSIPAWLMFSHKQKLT